MAVPKKGLNARIVSITRQIRGYGGDRTAGEVVLSDVDAHRQPVVQLDFPGPGDREAQGDTEFYFDLPADPLNIRVGDFVAWRRLVNGVPTGSTINRAEVRVVEVNDQPVRLSHVRIETRGGDGSGS